MWYGFRNCLIGGKKIDLKLERICFLFCRRKVFVNVVMCGNLGRNLWIL